MTTMDEESSAKEKEVGIESYATSVDTNPGFTAIIKARYSDFIVHEVDNYGKVARLTQVGVPKEEEEEGTLSKDKCEDSENPAKRLKTEKGHHKQQQEEQQEEQPLQQAETAPSSQAAAPEKDSMEKEETKNDPIWTQLENAKDELAKLTSMKVADEATALLRYWLKMTSTSTTSRKDDEKTQPKNYLLPLIEEKEVRTKIHQLIRSDFKGIAVADTVEKRIRLWAQRFAKEKEQKDTFCRGGNNNNNKNNRSNHNNNSNNNNNGRKSKLSNKNSQWPSDRPPFLKFVLYKENMDTNAALKELHRCSNIKPKHKLMIAGMKDKRGITTQFCTIRGHTPDQIGSKAHKRWSESNTGLSLLKVGNFEFTDRELSLGKLEGNRFDVVLRNLKPKSLSSHKNEHESIKEVLEKATTAFQEYGFINYFGMQRFGKNQDTHKVGMAILKGHFSEAIDILMSPKPNEHVRETSAKEKWTKRFTNKNGKDVRAKAEQACARLLCKELGRFMACELAVANSLQRRPLDYKAAFRSMPKTTQLMFLHAVQSYVFNRAASFRLAQSPHILTGDLVLTNHRHCSDRHQTGLAGKIVQEVTDLDIHEWTIHDVVLPLPGSKIIYPTNPTGHFMQTLLKEEIGFTEHTWVQSNRELSLGGDYRYLMCKPQNITCRVKKYRDSKEILLPTDLMALNDKASTSTSTTNTNTSKGVCIVDVDKDGTEKKTTNSSQDFEYGLVVGFTLPPSSYATIALRELMKLPTATDFQSKLSLHTGGGTDIGSTQKSSSLPNKHHDESVNGNNLPAKEDLTNSPEANRSETGTDQGTVTTKRPPLVNDTTSSGEDPLSTDKPLLDDTTEDAMETEAVNEKNVTHPQT